MRRTPAPFERWRCTAERIALGEPLHAPDQSARDEAARRILSGEARIVGSGGRILGTNRPRKIENPDLTAGRDAGRMPA